MKNQTRELLVISKAARRWHNDFDKKVDELMTIISKVDTEWQVQQSIEVLDVYHSALPEPARQPGRRNRGARRQENRPFEFIMFRN